MSHKYYTHLFIGTPASVVKRGAQCVYITYSSVTAQMDRSQTEVIEEKRWRSRAQRYKRFLSFGPSPQTS